MRIGFWGGTFDPPHWGHLILAAEARQHFSLDRVEWILTPLPPHKPERKLTPVNIRIQMLEAAIAGNRAFSISRVDLDRSPPYYAADSMGMIREQYPAAYLVYLIGSDSLRDLPAWYRPQQLLKNIDTLGVVPRLGAEYNLDRLEKKIPGLTDKFQPLSSPVIQISSSLIRKRVRQSGAYRYFLPASVRSIIKAQNLYLEE